MAKMMIVQILFFTLFVILSAAVPIQQVSPFFLRWCSPQGLAI